MTRITKPLTKQISLIFALFVTFSLFIGCGDESETLKPSATEEETRSLVLLAPGKKSDENLEVSLEPKDGGQEFVIIKEGDVLTIGTGENAYFLGVKNISGKKVDAIKVEYKVKCILNKDIEEEKKNPDSKPEDQCKGQVIISKVTETVGDTEEEVKFTRGVDENKKEKENEANFPVGDLEPNSEKIYKITVKLKAEEGKPVKEEELPPHGVSVRNEVCIYYCRELW